MADNVTSNAATLNLGNRLIAALDVPGRAEADVLVSRLGGAADWLKVGLELFIGAGPSLVRDYGSGMYTGPRSPHGSLAPARIMLDLKLHDIPATVARATKQAAALGAELLTVHAGGGSDMLRAAVEAAHEAGDDRSVLGSRVGKPRLRILAVTVLTSLADGDLSAAGLVPPAADLVKRRVELAVSCGCDGVVASPHEAADVRAAAPDILIVTPGVRPAGADAGDQKRVATPAEARRAGADLIVCGRPIRDAADPHAAAQAIVSELS